MRTNKSPAGRIWAKRALVAFLFLALIASVWAYTVVRGFTSKGGGMAEVWAGISNPRGLFPGKDHVVILVVGKDYNRDKKGMPYSKDSRSDTIMLISADLEHKRLGTISVPRDTRVEDEKGRVHKINAMIQIGGIPLLKRTLLREFGIYPDYHVVLKDEAVKNLVDAVGGVEVEPIDDMFYEDSWANLHIDLKAGRQRIDGDQAIGFVRFRKSGTHKIVDGQKVPIERVPSKEEGDIRRTERQQQLLRALGSEALTPKNLLRAESIIDTGFKQIETDLSRPQVLALATLFRGQSLSNSPSATLPGDDSMAGGAYYYVPDKERAQLLVRWILEHDEMAGRKMVRVIVFNGSETKGAARQAAAQLETEGYTVQVGGNQSDPPEHTSVTFRKAAFESNAKDVAAYLGSTSIAKDTTEQADWRPEIKVVIGKLDGERFKPVERT
jgi:LCP family protein required for cell wall assembly